MRGDAAGGGQALKFRLSIDRERCKGCGLCVQACLQAVLRLAGKLSPAGYRCAEPARPEACQGCRRCTDMCPEAAIAISKAAPGADTDAQPAAAASPAEKTP